MASEAPTPQPDIASKVPPDVQTIKDRYTRKFEELYQKCQKDLAAIDVGAATDEDLTQNVEASLGGGLPTDDTDDIYQDSSSDDSDSDLPPPASPDKTAVGTTRNSDRTKPQQIIPSHPAARVNPFAPPARGAKFPGVPAAIPATQGKSDKSKKKKERVRASKLEYKKLDELYNKRIHDFYLAETAAPTGKDDQWEEYLFIVRRRFDWQSRYIGTMVDIKSVPLRELLRDVLKDVSYLGLREDKPSIDPKHLFNYLPQLEERLEKQRSHPEDKQDKVLIQHLEVLNDYVTSSFSGTAKSLYPMLEHQEVTFELLWALFLPNTLVFTKCPGTSEPRVLKLKFSEYKDSPQRGRYFCMECQFMDFDGKAFGLADAILELDDFRGSRRIDTLAVFPLAYHDAEEELRDELVKRGRKFVQLKGMHHKMYDGPAFYRNPKKREIVRVKTTSRIVIDSATFKKINPNYITSFIRPAPNPAQLMGLEELAEDIDGGLDEDDMNASPAAAAVSGGGGEGAGLRRAISRRPHRTYMITPDHKLQLMSDLVNPKKRQNKADKKDLSPDDMTEEELLLCSSNVLGFSLHDKLWLEFAIDYVTDIEFNPAAFDALVIPENQKLMIKALVENHASSDNDKHPTIDDVIKGKGRGLVGVLHGRPGTGKTLTIEGISEYLRRPLYMVSAGELGTDARTLEAALQNILDVAYVWGAVLLLDEADIFLERRHVHELQRNSLVSVFLRQLEYFQGILFLTTNRVETFDEAFQSRIHIALKYNDLDRKAQRAIWTTFLGMVPPEGAAKATDKSVVLDGIPKTQVIVSEKELDELSKHKLNGRQIKNVVRSAQAMANSMKESLSIKHIKLVIEVTENFDHDLKGTGSIDNLMSYA